MTSNSGRPKTKEHCLSHEGQKHVQLIFFLIFISFYEFSLNLFYKYIIRTHISRISSWADLPLKLSNLQNRTRGVFRLQWGKRILYESHCLSDWLRSLCEPFEDTAVNCECEDEFLYPFLSWKTSSLEEFRNSAVIIKF